MFDFPMTQVPKPARLAAQPFDLDRITHPFVRCCSPVQPHRRDALQRLEMRLWVPACLRLNPNTQRTPYSCSLGAEQDEQGGRKGSVVGSDRGQARILHCPALGHANGPVDIRGGAIDPRICLGFQMGEMTSIWGLVTANKANLRGLCRPADAIFSLIRRIAMEDSWPSPGSDARGRDWTSTVVNAGNVFYDSLWLAEA